MFAVLTGFWGWGDLLPNEEKQLSVTSQFADLGYLLCLEAEGFIIRTGLPNGFCYLG